MEQISLIEAFSEFKDAKAVDKEELLRILTETFMYVLGKKYNGATNFEITINPSTGDVEIWRTRTIVKDGEVTDPNTQIAYSEAVKIEPDFEVGEELMELFPISNFNRREIQYILQILRAKVSEIEKNNLYQKYKDKVGEIITGEVKQISKKELLVSDDEDFELILPMSELIPKDNYRKGDTIRAVVERIEFKGNTPFIILSRTSPKFLEKLLEQEVPEIYDGLISIRKVVRQPGEKAKVAVESYSDRIDPVGACVGMKGSRIHPIVRELRNENIDVINYSPNLQVFVARALAPAKISEVNILEDKKKIEVYLKPDQISLAIGKGGINIKLASKLVGYEIEIFRDVDEAEYEDDVYLDEFTDEIDEWIIDVLKSIGCDTAKSVLAIPRDELIERTDLEEETIDEVLRILKSEFE